jgi:endonuclease YncB( thermonuclease family)
MIKVSFAGVIDLSQFWPQGKSDADTSKLLVKLRSGIRVQFGDSAKAVKTTVYDNAFAKGSRGFAPLFNAKGEATVRLQGIDAPELHVRPRPMKGPNGETWSLAGLGLVKDYRQPQGETATLGLAKRLAALAKGGDTLACEFVSLLHDGERPASVIDAFGRFVGTIRVGKVDVNRWLLESGSAILSIYRGMDREREIEPMVSAWQKGRDRGVARFLGYRFGRFEPTRQFRPGAEPEDEGDTPFLHPKFFRRQVSWCAYRKAGHFSGSFAAFLRLGNEPVYLAADFLHSQDSATPIPIHDRRVINTRELLLAPDEIVFQDGASRLFRDVNGRKVEVRHW